MLGCFSRPRRSSSLPPPFPKSNFHASSGEIDGESSAVLKNFNSLYEPVSDSDTFTTCTSQTLTLACSSGAAATGDDYEDDDCVADEPDQIISTAMASRRLFHASPGRSNSIVDSAAVVVGVGSAAVAVPTYSPDPYLDFRRSMEEMVAALGLGGRWSHLDLTVLRELFFCYLSLNRKHAHKYIVSAFADLLIALSTVTAAAEDEDRCSSGN
ncbi:hypothetical protein HPP92_023196 [Vanilla planifolia]|uniref:Transcription repressor n=1 Tax=Vanilla planifolia TaxID=51239 RepID=A0A835PZT4_VANPL|nr:hypothetical protein HPP92_023196 [Vanilla planifolia]